MLFSRILTLLAGALLGAALSRNRATSPADAPVRRDEDLADLTARLGELQAQIEAVARQMADRPDGRIDDLAARFVQLQPKIEALAGSLAKREPRMEALWARLDAVESKAIPEIREQVAELRQSVSAHEETLQAGSHVVAAVEQMLRAKMAEVDERLEAQGRTLLAMQSSMARSDELLECVLQLVRATAARAGTEPRADTSAGARATA